MTIFFKQNGASFRCRSTKLQRSDFVQYTDESFRRTFSGNELSPPGS